MHFQALLYLPLSQVIGDDLVCYNLIWLANLVFTGVGTFVLVWQMLRSRLCAFYGGLAAMLAGPVLLHAMGHLELITLGWFPLFLAAWMRWVDRPTGRGLLAAAGLYVLVAMSAGYFAVFALVPATLYVAHAGLRDGLTAVPAWVRNRLVWFCLFIAVTLPCLLLVFSAADRRPVTRLLRTATARSSSTTAPRSGILRSVSHHVAWQWLPARPYRVPVCTSSRTLLLSRPQMPCWLRALVVRTILRRRFWWALLASLIVLSFGRSSPGEARAICRRWLYDWCPPFRQLRVGSSTCSPPSPSPSPPPRAGLCFATSADQASVSVWLACCRRWLYWTWR
jgi:hypothetical protein